MMPPTREYEPVAVARQLRYIRELPGNRGQRVEAIQRWGGGKPGDPWCCFFLSMVLDICYQGASPIPRTGSCDVVLALARSQGWVVTDPQPNDIALRVRDGTDAHHIYLITNASPLTAISGNTDAAGVSHNGDRVAEKPLARTPDLVFVRLPAAA